MIRFRGFGPMFYVFLVSILLLMQSISRAAGPSDTDDLRRRAEVNALVAVQKNLGVTFEPSNVKQANCASRAVSSPSKEDEIAQACPKFCFKVEGAKSGDKSGELQCTGLIQRPDPTTEALKQFMAVGGIKAPSKLATAAAAGKAPEVKAVAPPPPWKLLANCEFVVPDGWGIGDDRDSLSAAKPHISFEVQGNDALCNYPEIRDGGTRSGGNKGG